MTTTTVLRPGDKVLVTFEEHVDYDKATEILQQLRDRFPDVHFACLGNAGQVIVERAEGDG